MKGPFASVIFCVITTFSFPLSGTYGQSVQDVSVQLRAEVQPDPAHITLHWLPAPGATSYTIHRKSRTATSWGTQVIGLPGEAVSYTDTTIMKGVAYEYRVTRTAPGYTGYGYILSGIEVPAIEDRGRLILVIEDTLREPLVDEINRLTGDLEGDGWRVVPIYVPRDTTPAGVRERIKAVYVQSPSFTKGLLLLGRVPVPYSGDLFPDGHPDHQGAWPADVYYADINGTWTDAAVTSEVATDARHRNVPGDGKLDQSLIPTDVELQTGRVDFANMPAFALSEIELIRQYLDKNHAFRHKLFEWNERGLIDDNFGYFSGEAFAASGFKSISPLVGPENVFTGDYFTTLQDSSYLWSYGCGGGWYQGAGGIGNTGDFAAGQTQSVFTILFGSYFGDWDSENNFLRAPLAQGKTLTNVWSGRPHWQFHQMGLGETIGFCTRTTQNNSNLYFASYGARFVHLALMGDPTLRNDIVAPPAHLQAEITTEGARLSWDPSTDPIVGYHVYMRTEDDEPFTRLTDTVVTDLTYDVTCLTPGTYTFMVRARALEYTPSGSYYNLSQGLQVEFDHPGAPEVIANGTWAIVGSDVVFVNFSQNATSFLWVFGDGQTSTETSPTHTYLDGSFNGYLVAFSDCDTDTMYFDVNIFTDLEDLNDDPALVVTPNPTDGPLRLQWSSGTVQAVELILYDAFGRQLLHWPDYSGHQVLDISVVPPGTYFLYVHSGENRSLRKIIRIP